MSEIDWSKSPDWADRVVKSPIRLKLFWANNNERRALDDSRFGVDGQHVRDNWEVVERRPAHFPARPPETFMCRCVAAPVSRTIEQRIASLRALEKKVEETRAELTRDLELLGLTFTNGRKDGLRRFTHILRHPIPPKKEPTITDWRDLRIGDVIEHVEDNGGKLKVGSLGSVCKLADRGIIVDYPDHEGYVYSCPANSHKFRFIRRP